MAIAIGERKRQRAIAAQQDRNHNATISTTRRHELSMPSKHNNSVMHIILRCAAVMIVLSRFRTLQQQTATNCLFRSLCSFSASLTIWLSSLQNHFALCECVCFVFTTLTGTSNLALNRMHTHTSAKELLSHESSIKQTIWMWERKKGRNGPRIRITVMPCAQLLTTQTHTHTEHRHFKFKSS